MKIPFTNLYIGRNFVAEQPTKQAKRAGERILREQLYRSRQRLSEWKYAVLSAESEYFPDRTSLTELYQEVINDLHMWSVMQTITLRVLATGFNINNESGDIDDEATESFRSKWFRDILKWFVESKFHGHSLVQIGGVQGSKLIDCELIPRQYVVPEVGAIKLMVSERLPKYDRIDPKSAIMFNDPIYSKWLIPLGDKSDLGLLQKTSPAVLFKKEMISSWAEYGEIFGMPFRTLFSDTKDATERAKLEGMLAGMGRAAWALLDPDDKFELTEPARTDAYKIFDAFIERMNSEISKAIVGQTMTSDDGSSLSQAEVHADLLGEIVSAYLADAADTINDVVFPKLFTLQVVRPGLRFAWDMEKQLAPGELVKIVAELSKLGDVPLDWLEEAFGIPLEKKADPILPPGGIPGQPGQPGAPQPGEGKEPEPGVPVDALARIKSLYARARAAKCEH